MFYNYEIAIVEVFSNLTFSGSLQIATLPKLIHIQVFLIVILILLSSLKLWYGHITRLNMSVTENTV